MTSSRIGPVGKCSPVLVESDEDCDRRRCVFAIQNNEGVTQREGVSWSYAVEHACIGSLSEPGRSSGTEGYVPQGAWVSVSW